MIGRRPVLAALLASLAVTGVLASPQGRGDNQVLANEETLMNKLNAKCSQRDASSCLMLKLVTYMNRLLKKSSIGVGDSLVITQTAAVVEEESPISRNLHDDGSDESQLGLLIADKLWNFVRSRSIKWSVLPEADLVLSATQEDEGTLKLGMNIRAGKALETGRGKMKNLGPVIAAGIMKIGMVGVLAFKALALLVGKALLVSKLAFLLAAVIGLKKLLSQERHVTYEVVAHPHHSHSEVHSGGGHHEISSGWGRSLDDNDAHSLAYSAHVPAPAPAAAASTADAHWYVDTLGQSASVHEMSRRNTK